MSPVTHIALSGLEASGRKLGAASHNVANAATDGFKASRVFSQTQAGGGVSSRVETLDTPGPRTIDPATGQERELSNVDLVREVTNLMEAASAFQANLKTIQAEDKILGALIDTIV